MYKKVLHFASNRIIILSTKHLRFILNEMVSTERRWGHNIY